MRDEPEKQCCQQCQRQLYNPGHEIINVVHKDHK